MLHDRVIWLQIGTDKCSLHPKYLFTDSPDNQLAFFSSKLVFFRMKKSTRIHKFL